MRRATHSDTATRLRRALWLLAVGIAAMSLAVLAAGCGGDGSSTTAATTETQTETETEPTETETENGGQVDGEEIFIENCAECHTLAAAGTTGTIGTNLDTSTLSPEQIEGQVRVPAGPMPSFQGQLSDEEIEAVATYVFESRTG